MENNGADDRRTEDRTPPNANAKDRRDLTAQAVGGGNRNGPSENWTEEEIELTSRDSLMEETVESDLSEEGLDGESAQDDSSDEMKGDTAEDIEDNAVSDTADNRIPERNR